MKNSKAICMLLSLMLMLLIGPAYVYAEEDDASVSAFGDEYGHEHYWEDNGDSCYCPDCGATKPHSWEESVRDDATCTTREVVHLMCTDCYAETIQYGGFGPHEWSEVDWWDMNWDEHYVYGRCCYVCDTFQKIPFTVKKGKTKRIVPKSFYKGASKKRVSYNKKKVKAKKSGTVKGKKRGARATVKWKAKFSKHGYKWWETYEADIIIK